MERHDLEKPQNDPHSSLVESWGLAGPHPERLLLVYWNDQSALSCF